jgi:segregation and condensation protein B
LNGDKFLKRLSVAALETLAIIAYKQPITKSEMEAIRGVNCDYAVQKLLEKDLVVITGRNEDAVGKPLVYATSKSFMDYFGINSTADLPKINEVLMEELIQATIVNQGATAENGESNFIEEATIEIETTEEPAAIITEEDTRIETETDATEEDGINLAVTPEGEIVENKQDKQEGEQAEDSEA